MMTDGTVMIFNADDSQTWYRLVPEPKGSYANKGSPLPTKLDGVSVTFNGIPAAVFSISNGQINVQVPSGLSPGQASVVTKLGNLVSAVFTVAIGQSAPEFFDYTECAINFVSALKLDYSLVGDPAVAPFPVSKAHAGEILQLYTCALGVSSAEKIVTPETFSGTVTVTAGNTPLTVLGAALVQAGFFQVNIQLPSNMTSGNYLLTITIPGGTSANSGVTVTLAVTNP